MSDDDVIEKTLKSDNDAQEVKEILEAVSEHVPKLLNEITEALFSPEKSEQFGEAVAKFYKSMIDAGMDEEKAFQLTQKFMDSSSPGSMISQAIGGSFGGHGRDDDELGDEIEKKVKVKIARKFQDD